MLIKVLDKGFLELQDVLGNDLAIVNAARVSYLGESKGAEKDKKLLFYLMKNRHDSPFEMAVMKFKIKCPLFVARQWMRHRTWSYNEVSRRYTSEELDFYYPEWRIQDTSNKQSSDDIFGEFYQGALYINLKNVVNFSLKHYHGLLEAGVAREMARMVLPQNMYTTFIGQCNLRNLLHFCHLRSDPHAQWEIRQYSDIILHTFIKEKFPWTYEAALEYKFDRS